MGPRRVAGFLAAVALLAGCTASDGPGRDGDDASGPMGRPGCRGVSYAEVRGPRPGYGPRELGTYAGERAVCAAYWVPGLDRRFVPQALAVDGRSVWVGGYQWSRRHDVRLCGLLRLDRRTGRPLARERLVAGAVGTRDPRLCRHGGGLALTDDGLWLVETRRLWLLDPALVGTGTSPVLRGWLLLEPLRGSVLVDGDDELGLGAYSRSERTSIHWFRTADLLAPGVLDLGLHGRTHAQVAARRSTPAPSRLQGGAILAGGTWLTRSTTRCGVLVGPRGRRVAAPPGIEDVEAVGRDLWAVSESGAKPYQLRGGRPMVPPVLRLDAEAVLTGPRTGCTI
jgi:hypothetical protein